MPNVLERRMLAFFRLNDAGWERHANPLSGWTRVLILPALLLALFSRVWIGWWSLVPTAGLLLWTWLNPRLFPPPRHFEHWMSRGVLGERLYVHRGELPIPRSHLRAAALLMAFSAAGAPFYLWGLVTLSLWPAVFGMALIMAGKLWFIDRMVWLYEDMRRAAPPEALRAGWIMPKTYAARPRTG